MTIVCVKVPRPLAGFYKTQLPDDANRLNRSGIEIKPIYSPDDWDSERYMDDLGFPGEAPWTREFTRLCTEAVLGLNVS